MLTILQKNNEACSGISLSYTAEKEGILDVMPLPATGPLPVSGLEGLLAAFLSLTIGAFVGATPYTYTAARTIIAPRMKAKFSEMSLNQMALTAHEIKIDKEVANPFNTLSAYFTTTATI